MLRLTVHRRQKESLSVMLYASAMALCVLAIVSVLTVILVKGGRYFWPNDIQRVELNQHQTVERFYGQLIAGRENKTSGTVQTHYSVTDWQRLSAKSRFVQPNAIKRQTDSDKEGSKLEMTAQYPLDVALIQLRSGNQLLAAPLSVRVAGKQQPLSALPEAIKALETLQKQSNDLLNTRIAYLDIQLKDVDGFNSAGNAIQQYTDAYQVLREQLRELQADMEGFVLEVKDASNSVYSLPLSDVEHYHFVNRYGVWSKLKLALSTAWEFVSESPKQLYASGGIFPAIVGTVMMVLLMTVFVTPLGVLVAIYLHEYATQNRLTTLIRISVNNLAGVPSIVYGVFGLSFFVYELGAGIDTLFYGENLPAPTFGAPGLFWASLTMAMLTLPVVVVATEEGLRRVPDSLRMGSYALGATQFEMIRKTVIPMASPGIMTGIILAIARGAGEVAPLILVGAVKYAPTLPVDSEYPFVHFQRQFMHLGVTIFDGAFQGQLNGSGSNIMFAACLFLLLIVLVLNIFAINIRHKLRRQYMALEE